MSDYTDDVFERRGPGFYRIYYGALTVPDGPFVDVRQMADETELYGYPPDGYVVYFDGEAISTVPSLNPDDLLSLYCKHCGESIYEDGTANWCHESDSRLTCDPEQLDRDEPDPDATIATPAAGALRGYIEAMHLDPADYGLDI